MTHSREIKGGSILSHIRSYNSRQDCFYTGEYRLLSPRPYGESCGEFLRICEYASRIPENKLSPYQPEQILVYESNREKSREYTSGNDLNLHNVQLVDFSLRRDEAKMEYTVDVEMGNHELYTLILPFLYIPLLQFSLDARVGYGQQTYTKIFYHLIW